MYITRYKLSDDLRAEVRNGILEIGIPVENGDLLGEALRVDLELLREQYGLSTSDLDYIGDTLVDAVMSRIIIRRLNSARELFL